MMKRDAAPTRIDVIDFTTTALALAGEEPAADYLRLAAELAPDAAADSSADVSSPDASPPLVRWHATGESRTGADGAAVPWLHVCAETLVPLVCQRCLAPVETELSVDRWFRFAPDEATAAIEDETADEDVLVAARDFDLRGLIEDELLMEIPITPRHESCPEPVRLSAVDPSFDAGDGGGERSNPFAVLGSLRPRKS